MRKRKYQISTRLNEQEKENLENIAKDFLFKSRTQLVNEILRKQLITANIKRIALNELQKQGNNLNQIAKRANSSTSLDIQILQTIEEIKETQKEILKKL